MHILILDHSVLAYKAFSRLRTQDYEGESGDEEYEFTRQYIYEVIYQNELHKPDKILWAMDCPRDKIWRHKVVRNFYGPRFHAYAVEWYPGTDDKTPENACRWYVECHNIFRVMWKDADGSYKRKQLTKKTYETWAKEQAEAGIEPQKITSKKMIKDMLPAFAKWGEYKGERDSRNWISASMDRSTFKAKSVKLANEMCQIFGGRIVSADELEADDIAYAATVRWYKHDITVSTIDMDWLQLFQHHKKERCEDGKYITREDHGVFKFWNANKYTFEEVGDDKVKASYIRKVIEGDDSDAIAPARKKGGKSSIGEKACDKIFDEVPLEKMYDWLKEHGDLDTLVKNDQLMNLSKIPPDLAERAMTALRAADVVHHTELKLSDMVSEATINMARIDGQKARQQHIIMGGNHGTK